MATKPQDPYSPLERSDQRDPKLSLGFKTHRVYQLFGLRILIQKEARCPLCDGFGRWTPPHLDHTTEKEACPCTLAARSGQTSAVFGKRRDVLTNAASHQGLLDAKRPEGRVGPAAGALQVSAAASVAAPTVRVVLREAPHLVLALLRMRLGLLQLRAQIGVLALQRPDALSHKGQMLAQHRRTAALVDQRLNLFEQRFKHFVLLRGVGAAHRAGEVA